MGEFERSYGNSACNNDKKVMFVFDDYTSQFVNNLESSFLIAYVSVLAKKKLRLNFKML